MKHILACQIDDIPNADLVNVYAGLLRAAHRAKPDHRSKAVDRPAARIVLPLTLTAEMPLRSLRYFFVPLETPSLTVPRPLTCRPFCHIPPLRSLSTAEEMMYMGMTLQMTQRLTQEQRLTLRQSLEQTLKLELRQELKLAIEQLLAMLQKLEVCLKLGMELSLTDHEMRTFIDSVLNVRGYEWFLISDRLGRMRNAGVLTTLFKTIGDWDGRFADLAAIGRMLERERRLEREQDQGNALALRIILRDPRWFGGGAKNAYDLWSLLCAVPQQGSERIGLDRPSHLRWVLAGGWAVELLTGAHLRKHHDIDTLVLSRKPLRLDTDVVVPTNYFDVLSCTGAFITQQCITTVEWAYKKKTRFVHVVKPEFLFASKFLRPPRPQDWSDVKLLIRRFCQTWDLRLIQKLSKRQACGFNRHAELLHVLASRNAPSILEALSVFHENVAYSCAS